MCTTPAGAIQGKMVGCQIKEDTSSSSLASGRIPALQPDPPCDSSNQADPASIPLPPSPPATISPGFLPEPNVGPGELGGSGRSSPRPRANKSSGHHSPRATTMSGNHQKEPEISFEDFATCYRQSQRKQAQRKRMERRLRTTKVSMGLSGRLIRIGNIVQRGLVEALKHDDKANFVTLYHMLFELQESCLSGTLREDQQDLDDREPTLGHSDFFSQLSPQSRADLLEILRLVRSDPEFLADRFRSLTPSQLTAFLSPSTTSDTGDLAFPSSSRSRKHYPYNRNPARSASFKDHAYAFERTDPLSILLRNVFAVPLEPESSEAKVRVDVWSSVCAQLISQGSSRFFPLIGQILSSWATGSNWKASSRFELYLMDILQTGAFLLEHIDTPPGMNFAAETLDPLRTDVAEEFFASAVDDLFQLLDDPDGGFPQSVLQLARAVLTKLDHSDTRSRFLEYLFVQWFFPKFLHSALTYPETHGLLLDFHIRKDAREKLLGQVGLRAYSQVFAILRSINHVSILRPAVKTRVDNMLSRFRSSVPADTNSSEHHAPLSSTQIPGQNDSSSFLLLSASDIFTLLDAIFPQSCASQHPSPASDGIPAWSSNISRSYNFPHELQFESGVYQHTSDDRGYSSMPQNASRASCDDVDLSHVAARIRFELTNLDELPDRSRLGNPSDEHWTIFSIGPDGRSLTWSLLPHCEPVPRKASVCDSDDDTQRTSLRLAENHEALQKAILRMAHEHHALDNDDEARLLRSQTTPSLRQRFTQAMASSHYRSDFVDAHYWWSASRQLRQGLESGPPHITDDSWILGPMHKSCTRSLNASRAVIDRCETDFISLDHSLRRLQTQTKELMSTVDRVRNKMWYMTDVKNSMRYEEARHVAMALKTMIYSSQVDGAISDETRSRMGARSLGGSLFQKPEVQVMNMMKAPSSQGGPKKLSDEQVELTRKWLTHNGIEIFCKGEERIHRFCYEVRTSINRLVGETMAETPVLWASELYQKERARYEGHGTCTFPGLSMPNTPRPSTTASEDPMQLSQLYGSNIPLPDTLLRLSHETPPLGRKPSIQSIVSDKIRPSRDIPSIDVSSIGGSPGRTASTSTGDSCSTFWSTPHRHPMYAVSMSSVYSRPPSMFSETATRQPCRAEQKTQGKTAFLDSLKQTLTSLLLSDLGSPVWSCGSETDAWFSNVLAQNRIRAQMRRRAAVQKFYTDYEERSTHFGGRCRASEHRRSRSLDTEAVPGCKVSHIENPSNIDQDNVQEDNQATFSYKTVFHRLIEVFSRHGNPFAKLNALRDLRSLVIASLVTSQAAVLSSTTVLSPDAMELRREECAKPQRRHSFSKPRTSTIPRMDTAQTLPSPPESFVSSSRRSEYPMPSEDQIVATLRDLILEVKPKTLFRDLQFISAFVPGDQLSKTDRGTAFLQFGLAALSLKDEVCHSMVEIADRIVSQELTRRHPLPGAGFSPPGHGIEDAAAMWIITAKEGNPVAQRELAILYLTHPELLPRVTLPLTRPRDTFKAEMMYRRDKDSKSDPQSMCLALHWMQLSAAGGDVLARNRLREREEFDSIA